MDWLQSQAKLFRAMLYCYPAEFRHEYGGEMEQLFADRLKAEPQLRLWLETIADLAWSVPQQHGQILIADLRYGARALASVPGFTIVALLVIALGIGATASIFSVVNAVLLRSFPYGHPEKLVYLWSPNANFKGVPQELSPNVPDFYDWERLARSFSSMTMLRQTRVRIGRDASASPAQAAFVSGSFFSTLEAHAVIGRTLDGNDDRPGHERVAVISEGLWQSQFGSDPRATGQKLYVNREPYTVIGVMQKDFGYPFDGDIPYAHSEFKRTDIWMPLAYTAKQKSDRVNFESGDAAIGRLREGASPAMAQAELASIEAHLNSLYPAMWRGWTALVKPLVQTIVGPVERMLWLLLGAVGIVLLIAMSNVANLLIARAAARFHEMGIRTALGADRARIIRQLLTESLLLSSVGGVLGIVIALAVVRLLRSLNPGDIPRFDTAEVDGRVLLLGVFLSIATGFIAGLAPAISASRANINDLLRSGGIRLAGGGEGGRSALIVLEVALSVVLLAGAGLLIRSYLELQAVDPGFSPAAVTFRINLDSRYNKPETRAAFYRGFLDKLQSLPGVKYVGATSSIPLSHHESVSFVEIAGFGTPKEVLETRSVTRDYRKALGTPLLRGRDFVSADVGAKVPVVMVNKSFADTYFQHRDPLGGRLRIGTDLSRAAWSTVVGVMGDIRHVRLEEASQPQIFEPVEVGDVSDNFTLRSNAPSGKAVDQVRLTLRSLDPELELENVHTMDERMTENNARRTFQTSLLVGFAGIAVMLALVGLYGLISFAVKQRTAEIGVRLALGSSRGRILGLVVFQGLRLTAFGLVIGMGAAFAVTRLASAWLFNVKPADPATFIAVPLFVLATAACACLIPAWTTTRIDPVKALRQE